MPFREEGELFVKGEKLVSYWGDRMNWIGQQGLSPAETNVVSWQVGLHSESSEEPGSVKGFSAGQSQVGLVL